MWVILPQRIVLLTSVMTLEVCGRGCTGRWFGENCAFKCHCDISTTCDDMGECPNTDSCETGYFGPGCQYLDVLMEDGSESNERYLLDNDDTTCNPQKSATFVELSLNRSLPFSWFRIHVKDSDKILNFTTTLNEKEACSGERKFIVNKTIVDVTCDVDILVNKLRIEGSAASSICTVYISGGRNVALKQTANQTSNLQFSPADQTQASNAVDGNSSGTFEDKHCSHTDVQATVPSWTLTYNRPQILYSVRIYNRDSNQIQLKGFTLETFSTDGQQTSEINDTSTVPWDSYDVLISTKVPVASLTISQSNSFAGTDKVLVLCEVETYGDTVCPDDMYGLFCSESCSCNVTEVCNVVTGACAPVCPAGFYGSDCSSLCSETCLHQICEHHSGHCVQCPPGYLGLNCTQECQDGWYGDGCTDQCPIVCKDRLCEKDTGDCVACRVNNAGTQCKDCANTYYGLTCDKRCSDRCLNRTCTKRYGQCLSCVPGYQGKYCEFETTPLLAILIPLSIFFMILCVSFPSRAVKQVEETHV